MTLSYLLWWPTGRGGGEGGGEEEEEEERGREGMGVEWSSLLLAEEWLLEANQGQ